MPNYSRARDGRDPKEVREELVDHLRKGATIGEALKLVRRGRTWYETQRREDKDWASYVDKVRTGVGNDPVTRSTQAGSFKEFSETYLRTRVWPHMQNVVDLIEGREPSWLHPAMIYEPGTSGHRRLLVNVPPNHAKSMTVTINYATYRIAKDPNVRIIVISKTQEQAKKFLYAMKQRLTNRTYLDLQMAFGPPEGYRASADQWTATRIYLGGGDGQEKDPTVEALGIGGQVYGARADLIIVDDAVTLSNANEWASQMSWLTQEVSTRLGPGGALLVLGTRVQPVDLYKELRNPDHYFDQRVPYTYLGMPAVLDMHGEPKDWVTLWPKSEQPFDPDDPEEKDADGLYDRWSGPRLAAVRNEVGPSRWSLVYQQADVDEEAVFDPLCVRGSVNGARQPGPLKAGTPGHPQHPDGFYRICSMDPAIAGDCAAVAYAVDRETGKRYVEDVWVRTGPTPAAIRELITAWTTRYRPQTWVIEENAFQGFLSQDEEIRRFLASQGVVLRPHHTGANKKDPDFGVASMAGLFGTKAKSPDGRGSRHQKDNLIELPSSSAPGVKLLIEQLVVWSPNVKTKHRKQDTVMALWFAELVARETLQSTERHSTWFMESSFTSMRDLESRAVINLDEWAGQNPVVYL